MRIQEINAAIDELARSINEHPHLHLGVEQFKGYVAEEFHAGTFNLEAIRQGSSHRAYTLHENSYGSVDIDTNFGKQYSLKYANTAEKAEAYQAVLDRDTNLPKYHGQERLIAAEQVDEAKSWAIKRAGKDSLTRQDAVKAIFDTQVAHCIGHILSVAGRNNPRLAALCTEILHEIPQRLVEFQRIEMGGVEFDLSAADTLDILLASKAYITQKLRTTQTKILLHIELLRERITLLGQGVYISERVGATCVGKGAVKVKEKEFYLHCLWL
jgi:hypothetical protein